MACAEKHSWLEWVIRDENGEIIGFKEDTPPEVIKAYKDFFDERKNSMVK